MKKLGSSISLFLFFLLVVCSCHEANKKEPVRTPAAPKDSGPKIKPDMKVERPDKPAEPNKGLSRYRSCDELQEAVHRALSYKRNNEAKLVVPRRRLTRSATHSRGRAASATKTTSVGARPRAARPSGAKSKSAPPAKKPAKKLEQFTNIQEVGVDEPDHVKIGPDNIYLLRGREIQVASRKALKHRGRVQLSKITKAKKLLITARHLFVLGEEVIHRASNDSAQFSCRS